MGLPQDHTTAEGGGWGQERERKIPPPPPPHTTAEGRGAKTESERGRDGCLIQSPPPPQTTDLQKDFTAEHLPKVNSGSKQNTVTWLRYRQHLSVPTFYQ